MSRIWGGACALLFKQGGAGIDRVGLAAYQTLRRNGLVIELSSLLNTVTGTKRVVMPKGGWTITGHEVRSHSRGCATREIRVGCKG